MDSFWVAVKTIAIMAAMVLVCIGLPIWGATGSLAHAWRAVREYTSIMLWALAIGGGLGIIVAFTG